MTPKTKPCVRVYDRMPVRNSDSNVVVLITGQRWLVTYRRQRGHVRLFWQTALQAANWQYCLWLTPACLHDHLQVLDIHAHS